MVIQRAMPVGCGRRLFYAARFAIGLVVAWGAATAVWSAPENILPWPGERDLVTAMRAGGKGVSNPAEPIQIRAMHGVMVGEKEPAFVVSVWFPERGRNFSAGVFLYRPDLKSARELDYSQSMGLQYVGGRYGEFTLLEKYGSGQGSEEFVHSLVRFNGWGVQVLHQARFGNNLGNCAENSSGSTPCKQSHVHFQLLTNPTTHLVEMNEVTTRLGSYPKYKFVTTSRHLMLDGDRFRPVKNP